MPYLGQTPTKGDENNFKILDNISSYTLTFDGSDAAVVSAANDTITSLSHRFVQGQRVTYNKGGGTVITGLSDGVYYIIKHDHNTIKLATSASNATNGVAVNITGVGAGSSHTLNVAFDGVNTKFKATHTNGQKAKITRSAQLVISINGVIQQPHDSAAPSTGFGFDLDGTIVFSQAPVAGDVYWAHVLTNNNVTFDISDNHIDRFTGNANTTAFNLSKSPPDNRNVLVTIDGVVQYPNDPDGTVRAYNVVENVLTFTTAPATGTEIQVRHIGFAGATSGGGGVTNFYGRTGSVVLKNTDNIVANNAEFAGNLTVNGTMTTLDTKLTEVDQLEVAANNTTVGVAITQSGSGDILNLYDGSTEVFSVIDGGNILAGGTSVPGYTGADDLTIGNETGGHGITIRSNQSSIGGLFFSYATSPGNNGTQWAGGLEYAHSSAELRFYNGGNVTAMFKYGHFQPWSDSQYDLGTTSKRWRNVLSDHLNLSANAIISGDLDVDGHTELDQLNVSGVTTSSHLTINGDLTINDNYPSIYLNDTDSNSDFMLQNQNGTFTVYDVTNNADRFEITSTGTVRSPHYTLQSQSPSLTFNDTNHDSDFMIQNANGLLKIYDNTNGADRFGVNSSGSVFVYGNELYIGDSIIHHGDTNTKIRFPANDTFTVETGGAERIRIASNGRIGIGTDTNFTATLNLHGFTNPNAVTIKFENRDSSEGIIQYFNGGMYIKAAATSGDKLIQFQTSGSPRLTIDPDGDVIIGTSSWQYKKPLNVQGSSGHILSLYNGDTTTYAANTLSGIELKLLTGNTGNQFGSCEIRAFKENGTNGDNARALSFYTGVNGGAPNERLRIFSDGRVQIAGQNAIAATSLTHRLLVRSQNDSNAIAIAGRNGDHIGELSFYQSDASTKLGEIEGHTTHLAMMSRTGYVSFHTNGAHERVRIDTNGRLLVGRTTGNSANLLVQSGAQVFAGANNGNSSCLTLDYNTATGSGRIMGHASSGGSLEFFTNASGAGVTPKLYISSSGLVGIGTVSPAVMHHLYSTSGGLYTRFEAPQGQVNFGNSNGAGIIHVTSISQPLRVLVNGTNERLRITSAGQVNVNASSESLGGRVLIKHSVDYTTTDFDDDPTLYLLNDDRTTGVSEAAVVFAGRNTSGSTYRAAISGNGSTGLKFYTTSNTESDDTPAMIINGSNKIGINYTSPAYPLDVRHSGGNLNQTPIIRVFQSSDGCHNAITLESSTSADKNIGIQFKNRNTVRGGIGYIQNDKINIYTGTNAGAANGMTINASGFCGINETSPDTYLHIKGTGEMLRLETTASGGGQCYIDFDDETATRASIGLRGSSSDTLTIAALNAGLRFDVQNATQALVINSNGCLQHGTASGVSYFTGSSEYIFGSTTSSPPAGGFESPVQIHTSKTRSAFTLAGYNNNSGGPFMTFLSSRSTTRGTLGSKVQSNDYIGSLRFTGDNGTNYNSVAHGATIYAQARSTPADGNTSIAADLNFALGSGNNSSVYETVKMQSDGKLRYGVQQHSTPHAVQARSFSLYPNNGSQNMTRFTFTGLVSGCYIAQIGYYNSAGQGYGGLCVFVSGYQTHVNTYNIHTIQSWNGANTVQSSIAKYNQSWVVEITNNHASYTGGGEVGIIGEQGCVVTVTYH